MQRICVTLTPLQSVCHTVTTYCHTVTQIIQGALDRRKLNVNFWYLTGLCCPHVKQLKKHRLVFRFDVGIFLRQIFWIICQLRNKFMSPRYASTL